MAGPRGFCKTWRYNAKLRTSVHEEIFAGVGVENMEKCAVDPGRQLVYCRPGWAVSRLRSGLELAGLETGSCMFAKLRVVLAQPG